MKLLDIALDDIDLRDERFRISYYFDRTKLVTSIKKIGLISPILVVERGISPYVILSGWKRILACSDLNIERIPAVLIEEKKDSRAFLFSLYENWTIRKFDLLEKAEIIQKLKRFIHDEKNIVREFFPLLEIPENLSYLDTYLRLARLDPAWKKIICEKRAPFQTAELLTQSSPKDLKRLLPLVKPLNMNTLKQLIEDLQELSKKTGKTLSALLSSPDVRAVVQAKNLSTRQKAQKIRNLVRNKRYPHLSGWTTSFGAAIKKAKLSKDIILDSSFFEDGEFAVKFDLHDKEAFFEKVARLEKLGDVEDLFSLFEGLIDE